MTAPSEDIFLYMYIQRWYGAGGNWINTGLPIYLSINRKLEKICWIHSLVRDRSGIILGPKLEKLD